MYTAKILNSIRWKCVIQLKYLYIKKCTLEKDEQKNSALQKCLYFIQRNTAKMLI